MTTFEYLAVFVSIVIGLAVVRLLRGLIELATGEGLESYWVHTAWLAYHVLWLPYFWWFTFGWRNQSDWTYPLFFFIYRELFLIFNCTNNFLNNITLQPKESTAQGIL